jgi:hypothetical protein
VQGARDQRLPVQLTFLSLLPGRSKRCLVFIRSGFGANVVAICFGAAPDSEGGETREQHNIAGHRPPCAASPCH